MRGTRALGDRLPGSRKGLGGSAGASVGVGVCFGLSLTAGALGVCALDLSSFFYLFIHPCLLVCLVWPVVCLWSVPSVFQAGEPGDRVGRVAAVKPVPG